MKAKLLNDPAPKMTPLPTISDFLPKKEEHHELFKEDKTADLGNSLHRETVWSTYVKFNRESKSIQEMFEPLSSSRRITN